MKVLIVGAGIGGLTTAIALRRAGIDATVFEQASELREVGAGISLWPNAIKALRRLGVGDEVENVGSAVAAAETRDHHGALLHSSPVDQLVSRFGAPLVMVHRAALHAALVSALDQDTIRLDSRCVALTQESGCVRLKFADQSEATGHVVIGADGLRSVVRAMTLGDGPPRARGLRSWRAVTDVDASLADELTGGEWWGRGSVFGAQHLPNRQVYWYAAAHARNGAENPRNVEKEGVLDLFENWHAPVSRVIKATAEESILRNDLFDRPAPKTVAFGRVALLGDAGHPMLPYLGQGACQAIEDGEAVADALAGAVVDPERALEIYSRERLQPATMAVVQSMRMSRVAHARNSVVVALRGALLRRTSTEATLKRLGPIVGGGPNSTDSSGASEARR
jgi:2-polyprenyl-6-methoxyphenol hydroxylase-like FAD-dependent oxidoreductase